MDSEISGARNDANSQLVDIAGRFRWPFAAFGLAGDDSRVLCGGGSPFTS